MIGIYDDMWTANIVKIKFSAIEKDNFRTLFMTLHNPYWRKTAVDLQITCNGNPISEPKKIKAGRKFNLSFPLPEGGAIIEMNISPTFNPARIGLSADSRELGLRCLRCELASRSGKHNLL